MPPFSWKVVSASVAGFSHLIDNLPCQDQHAFSVLPKGWLVAVVSDGAGSAPLSQEGAAEICKGLVERLSEKLPELEATGEEWKGDTIRAFICEGIELARARLGERQSELRDFAATVVGAIAGSNGGVLFHIGDGAACATVSGDLSSTIMSLPENGEYANETYFFTQDEWREHLRITTFGGNYDLITLMSDGVTPFALAPRLAGPHIPFFEPLSRYFADHDREEGCRALGATLQSDSIRRITGDDKTLLWAVRIKTDG
jgi:hypothetical protein